VPDRIDRLTHEPFDLTKPPLLRAALWRIGQPGPQPEWVLGLCAHHLIVDGWSVVMAGVAAYERHHPAGRHLQLVRSRTATAHCPARVPMHRHRFDELQVGPDITRDPALWVASVHVVPIVDLLLGADWLRSRHVWLSFATKQMFVAGK